MRLVYFVRVFKMPAGRTPQFVTATCHPGHRAVRLWLVELEFWNVSMPLLALPRGSSANYIRRPLSIGEIARRLARVPRPFLLRLRLPSRFTTDLITSPLIYHVERDFKSRYFIAEPHGLMNYYSLYTIDLKRIPVTPAFSRHRFTFSEQISAISHPLARNKS